MENEFKVNDKVIPVGDTRVATVCGFEEKGTYWGDKGQTVVILFEENGPPNYFAPYELKLVK